MPEKTTPPAAPAAADPGLDGAAEKPNADPVALGQATPRLPEAGDAPPIEPTPDVGQPPAPTAAYSGPPACAKCATPVPPGAERCPKCGIWQPDNTGHLTHGLRSKKLAKIVDAYRVELIEQLFAERGGREALDVVSRIAIENYALVCAQHKTIEARLDQDGLFTQTGRRRSAFDMLKAISETIDRLRGELPPTLAAMRGTPKGEDRLTGLSEADLRARLLESRARLDEMLDASAPIENVTVPNARDAGFHVQVSTEPTGEVPVPTVIPAPKVASAPDACPYCHRPCVGPEHPAFNLLHYNDPQETKKRNDRATAEMFEALRRQR